MYLIIGVLVSALVPYFLAKSSRVYAFGLILAIGGGSLGCYYHFHEPLTISQYLVEEIKYERVYFKESADKIVLVSGEREYGLAMSVLKFFGQPDPKPVTDRLRSSSNAKVWLDGRDFIMGIESEHFRMPPDVGLDYDNRSIKASAKIGWFPAVIGLLAILVNFADSRLLGKSGF